VNTLAHEDLGRILTQAAQTSDNLPSILINRVLVRRGQIIPTVPQGNARNKLHVLEEELVTVAFPCINLWHRYLVFQVVFDEPHTLSFAHSVPLSVFHHQIQIVEIDRESEARDALR
jgi:hypothetical protein